MPNTKTSTLAAAFHTKSVVKPANRFRSKYLTMRIATAADSLPAWGQPSRDKELRAFMRKDDFISSAVYTMSARYAGFPYQVIGGPRTADEVRNMLAISEHGKGWNTLWSKVATDSFSCDNAGWVELYRERRPGVSIESSPVVQLNHLDSLRCHRTGKWDQPVDYEDSSGTVHHMYWYDVLEMNDFPQPDEDKWGLGFCAVSRIARAAQIMRDISIHTHEKVSGQFNKRVTIVNGVAMNQLNDTLEAQRIEATNQGLLRYIQPALLSSIDPRAPLNKIEIDLAAMPDWWDEDIFMKWFIVKVALAFGEDPQEFAPLPGNSIGSSQQSEILHLKGRTKGPNLWMSTVEHQFKFLGIVPNNVLFKFGEQDTMVSVDKQKADLMLAQQMATLVKAGIVPPMVAAQILADRGVFDVRYLEAIGQTNLTQEVVVDASGPSPVGKMIVPSAVQGNKLGGGMSNSTTQPMASGIR